MSNNERTERASLNPVESAAAMMELSQQLTMEGANLPVDLFRQLGDTSSLPALELFDSTEAGQQDTAVFTSYVPDVIMQLDGTPIHYEAPPQPGQQEHVLQLINQHNFQNADGTLTQAGTQSLQAYMANCPWYSTWESQASSLQSFLNSRLNVPVNIQVNRSQYVAPNPPTSAAGGYYTGNSMTISVQGQPLGNVSLD